MAIRSIYNKYLFFAFLLNNSYFIIVVTIKCQPASSSHCEEDAPQKRCWWVYTSSQPISFDLWPFSTKKKLLHMIDKISSSPPLINWLNYIQIGLFATRWVTLSWKWLNFWILSFLMNFSILSLILNQNLSAILKSESLNFFSISYLFIIIRKGYDKNWLYLKSHTHDSCICATM